VSLLLSPALNQGVFVRHEYNKGKIVGARWKNGKTVAVDAFGVPV
jgi:hypothetical protein